MTPASIGLWMVGYGFLNGAFQFVTFPHIVERFGPRRIFIDLLSETASSRCSDVPHVPV